MAQIFSKAILMMIAAILVGTGAQAATVSQASFASHDIQLVIDVPSHTITVVDTGMVELSIGSKLFELAGSAKIEFFRIDGKEIDLRTMPIGEVGQLEFDTDDSRDEFDTTAQSQLVLFESELAGTFGFAIGYSAELFQDVSNTRFSNEMVGREITGTILEEGAYLSGSSYYYPVGGESLTSFALTADIPNDWESVCDGNRLESTMSEDGTRKRQSWANPYQSDGCIFMAAPFVVRSDWVDSVEVACYFFAADTGLFDEYLSATTRYITMYNDLIGEYPYKRFTVAENFFPTGYGMPAWTLLGQQVLRLPFIKYTSLGHEVLHNWWGNSVYVDYKRGNWCEAATVYGADYRYKLMRSPDDARQYRKDILKQYNSYINEGNDFPIREFQSRTSPGSRTIGYNKGMMVYHMIEEIIGTEAFFDSWKAIYNDYREKQISWEEWLDQFEKASGDDLSYIIPQWIDRAGAPLIDIADVTPDIEAGRIQFRLAEKSGQDYRLKVPLRFSGAETVIDTSVELESNEATFTLPLPTGATTLEIDPDYHLFRQLYPEEVEPVISAVLGGEVKTFVCDGSPEMINDFTGFAENIIGDSVKVVSMAEGTGALFVLNPSTLPDDLTRNITFASDTITVDGTAYPSAGHTLVLTGRNWHGYGEYMVVISSDGTSLGRIGQLIPHYGKYSYLVFEGAKNVGKGNWEVTDSRLRVSLE